MAVTDYVMRGGKRVPVSRGGKGSATGGKFTAKANAAAAVGATPTLKQIDDRLEARVRERFMATHAWARDPKNRTMLDNAIRYLVKNRAKHRNYTNKVASEPFYKAIKKQGARREAEIKRKGGVMKFEDGSWVKYAPGGKRISSGGSPA